MPFVPCQCTNCGGQLEVDNAQEAAVCKFCGTPFIVEKAIQIYKTVNVTTNTTDWKRLARNGMNLVAREFFSQEDLYDIRKILRDVSEEEFYVRFFDYVLEDDYSKENILWLSKNVPSCDMDLVVEYLYRDILKTFPKKERIEDIHFNISINYTKVAPDFALNDKALRSLLFLTYMEEKLSEAAKEKYEVLKREAKEEIEQYSYESKEDIYAIGFFVWAYEDFLGHEYCLDVKKVINSHCMNLPMNSYKEDFGLISRLKNMGYEVDYQFKVSKDCIVGAKEFTILGKTLPLENALAMCDYEYNAYFILKLDDKRATIVLLPGVNNTNFLFCFPSCDHINFCDIERLSKYKDSYKGYKMEYVEGFSYKPTVLSSIMKLVGKIIK